MLDPHVPRTSRAVLWYLRACWTQRLGSFRDAHLEIQLLVAGRDLRIVTHFKSAELADYAIKYWRGKTNWLVRIKR
jgi:hypothetical protein